MSYDEAYELLSGILAGAIVLLIFLFIILIAWAVFYYIGMWKFYKKAGQEGWKCLIPFYNQYVMAVDMGGLKWYWFLIMIASTFLSGIPYIGWLISLASLFGQINCYYNLSKKLNKTTGWIVLTVLFGGITLPLLGYSNNTQWNQAAPVDGDGLLTSVINKNNNSNTQQSAPQNDANNTQQK